MPCFCNIFFHVLHVYLIYSRVPLLRPLHCSILVPLFPVYLMCLFCVFTFCNYIVCVPSVPLLHVYLMYIFVTTTGISKWRDRSATGVIPIVICIILFNSASGFFSIQRFWNDDANTKLLRDLGGDILHSTPV